MPRYAEVDQQGVVFNGHYLTWFDEACTGFLDHLGVTYPGLIDSGHDIQVVHSEIDFLGPCAGATPSGSRSIARESDPRASRSASTCCAQQRRSTDEQTAVRGHNVYVVVSTEDWAKRPIPDVLREALISVERQARNAAIDS